ncbi:MAG: hypothetical protein VX951_05730 [Planctomycetota bacterium]|nr:hypothetical protein [Planctomycetota bacterium]
MDRTTDTQEVSEALTARSTITSVDELARRGRKQVKVIRASDIATMITESVYEVVHEAAVLNEQDVEQLVLRSRAELGSVLAARQAEAASRHDLEVELDQLRTALADEQARIRELQESLANARRDPGPADPHAAEMMRHMVREMAEIKAGMAQRTVQQRTEPATAENIDAALDKIASSLDQRLDQFDRKMGIGKAVETQDVQFDTLFPDDDQASLESNIEDVELKKNTGAGIAGNLERLKKLKGDE